jgi:hypothetical protein
MILNNIKFSYVGDKPVNYIYHGTKKVYPPDFDGIWQFNQIPSAITNFSVTTSPSGTILVNWGDGSQNTINSGTNSSKTYL